MAKRNQDDNRSGTKQLGEIDVAAAQAGATFVEGLTGAVAPPPEAVASAASAVADILTKPDADQNADIIAAFYAGKKLGALELCAHLENNWGAECGIAARDWRTKLEAVPS